MGIVRGNGIRRKNYSQGLKMARWPDGIKRKPITLIKNGDGKTYTIVDGNSTYGNARHSKWKQIPAILKSPCPECNRDGKHLPVKAKEGSVCEKNGACDGTRFIPYNESVFQRRFSTWQG